MTATPRLWQLGNEDQEGAGELVASLEDDPDGPFGSRASTLRSRRPSTGESAPPTRSYAWTSALQAAQLLGAEGRSEQVRGARLAALHTALVKPSAEESFRRTLVFHHVAKEAVASCPTWSRPWGGRCGCSQARESWPAWSCSTAEDFGENMTNLLTGICRIDSASGAV